MSTERTTLFTKIFGCLAGGALGDAMGGVTEMMHYNTIEKVFGEVTEPRDYGRSKESARFDPDEVAGRYTDDTRLKHLLVDLIEETGGRVTADQVGHFLVERLTGWYFTPVINTYHKLISGSVRPREAGRGNMGSNSTAMAIAPIGVINAGDPAAAARDAYDVASVIHEDYSLDSAACIAAAVAAAFNPTNSVSDVIDEALRHLDQGNVIAPLVEKAVQLAKDTGNYSDFRARFYEQLIWPWPQEDLSGEGTPPEGFYDTAEPREAIPLALGLFYLVGGDPREGIIAAANFGRDSDTIGSILGGLCGAFAGIDAVPTEWVDVLNEENDISQHSVTIQLHNALIKQMQREAQRTNLLNELMALPAGAASGAEAAL